MGVAIFRWGSIPGRKSPCLFVKAEEFSQPAALNLDFSEAIAPPLLIAKEIIEANLVFARPSEKEPVAMVTLPEKQVSEVFQMTVTGKIVTDTDRGAIYLVSLDGTSLRLSKNPNDPLPTDIQRWYVLPGTDSTGQISGVRILGYEPVADEPDICLFTGRVIQIGKRNSQVLFKVSFVGQKDLKITLTEPLPQMKAGHLWRVNAKRKGESLYIEHAEPLEAITQSAHGQGASTQTKSSTPVQVVESTPVQAAGTIKRIVQRVAAYTNNLEQPPSKSSLVEETFEETTARLLPIAQKALTETTNQTGWILSNPVQRGNLWEWEATLSKSDTGLGILARIQVNPYTEASKVIEFPTQSQVRDVATERLYAEVASLTNDDDVEDDDSEADSDSQAGTLIERRKSSHKLRLIVTPLGAARGIGASCFRVEIGPYEIVLDAGTRPKGNNPLPAFEHLKNPNLILITHAHQDHIGALPVFYKRFPGTPMICTAGTREIAHVMLTDCLKVQQSNEDFEQLFDEFDLEQTLFRLQMADVGKDFEPLPGLKVRFIHAGHILGAACVYLRYGERSLLYTGDYNTTNSRTTEGLRLADLPEADMLITESTYGADTHPSRKAQETELLQAVAEVVQAGGNVLIPAFALGRAQEIILAIRTSALFHSLKIPVYVDGLVRAVTDVFRDHIELLPTGVQNFAKQQEPFFAPSGTPPIIPIAHPRERPLAIAKPSVVIASSGMLSGGASVYYGQVLLERDNAAIFISGYTDEESPGRFLQGLNKGDTVEIEGKELTVRATVRRFNLSAHADKVGLTQVIHRVNPKHLILIHGSMDALHQLARTGDLKDKYIIHIPSVGEAIAYDSVPERISTRQLAKLEKPQEFEVELVAEVEGAWLRIPESVLEDPRWQNFGAAGVLKAKWTSAGLYLTPISQRTLTIEAARASGEDCCAVCEFFDKKACQCPESPLFTRSVDPRAKCLEFQRKGEFSQDRVSDLEEDDLDDSNDDADFEDY
jgi:Cft2 family RNA processing exonuclease